jgi:preprotein translocase subunit YajC
MFSLLMLFAEGEAPQGGQSPSGSLLIYVLPLMLLWLLFFRPGARGDKQRQKFLSELKKNDKIVTIGGIVGSVVSVSDTEDEVIIKVDDNTRLKMIKSSIQRNLSQEEDAKKKKEEKKAAGA